MTARETDGGASETTEPAAGSSTGTDVSLRDYIDSAIRAMDRRVDQRFILTDKALDAALTAAKEAVDKAERAAEKRFESTNEFRGQLADQATTFQRRDVAQAEATAIHERLRVLENTRLSQHGREQGTSASIGYFLAAATILIALAAVVVTLVAQ